MTPIRSRLKEPSGSLTSRSRFAATLLPRGERKASRGARRVSMVQSEAGRVHALKALVFDSGLGGLTVLRELARARPDLVLVYAADDAAFPYGRLGDGELVDRVCKVMERLIAEVKPDLVVIACNTASTLVLPVLRARFAIPFVGTVPAIKPACERSKTKRVSVLATPGTVRRDYTQELIREFAGDCKVTLVGSERLASLAESALRGRRWPTMRSRPRSRPVSSMTAPAPIRWCWPAPIIRCCSIA